MNQVSSFDPMLGQLIGPEIRQWLAQKNYKELRQSLIELDPFDIAEALMVLSPEERAVVFRILPRPIAAEVFAHLPLSYEEELLHSMGTEQVSALLNQMVPDDRTALLEELPGNITRRLIESLSPQERTIARTLLGYPEDSVGRRMTPEYVSVQAEWTAEQTLEHIRTIGKDKETVHYVYVTNDKDHLQGYLPIKNLLTANPDTPVSGLMRTTMVTLNATDDQEIAADRMGRYDLPVLPVIDSDGTFVGIVTADDVFDVAEEEATEDMHLMGGLSALEEPYPEISFFTLLKKRAVILLLLFVGGSLTVYVIRGFESAIQPILVFFLPLIISSGGNTGTQATTLIIRALSVQEIQLTDWWRVLMRELGSGLMLGLLLGGAAVLLTPVLTLGSMDLGQQMLLGSTVGVAIVIVVMVGAIIGSMLPFILSALRFDPAMSSTPLVATVMDATGILIYFSIAMLMYSTIA